MRRRALRNPHGSAVLATAAVALLLAPGTAWAHVTMTPPFVDAGAKTTVSFELPNERPEEKITADKLTSGDLTLPTIGG